MKKSLLFLFALDCSRSLGDLFPVLKQTANSFIDRLAGGDGDVSAIDDIKADDLIIPETDAAVEYYNLQGIRVTNPTGGIYIRRCGNRVSKILIND